jgi:hypothetical protein
VKIKPDRLGGFIEQNEDHLIGVLKSNGTTILGDALINHLRDKNKL